MDRFNAMARGTQIMLVGGALLLIVSFFDWQAVDDFPGISAWHGFWGVVMGLLTIVLLAWIVAGLAGVDIPLPVSAAMISIVLGGLIFICALIKNLTDDFSTFWAYLGLALAAVIAIGAWMQVQAAGGIDTLKGEIPTRSTSGTTMSAPPAEPPPAPATPPPAPPATERYTPDAAPADTTPEDPDRDRET